MAQREQSDQKLDVRRLVAGATAGGGSIVLSYIGRDGFPRSCTRLAAVHAQSVSQVVLSVPLSDGEALSDIEIDPRVGLLCQNPSTGTSCRLSGRARRDGALRASGTDVAAVVIDVEKVEPAGAECAVQVRPGATLLPTRPLLSQTSAVLDVSGLSIYYGPKCAVRDLCLKVFRGEIFGLLGPNGAGKTSTLSAIEGLRKPRSGTISLDGTDVLRHPIEAKAKMGVQLQATSFQSSLNIKQIVRLFAGLYGSKISDEEVLAVIASVGLEGEAGKPFKQLSGGQQQRLALQVAVIHKPVLLLLDEPTSGLDPQARRQLWGRIESLRGDGGSILLTTHSMEEAQAVCDRVAIVDHGEILTSGSPQELIVRHRDDAAVRAVAHGDVTLDDVFVGLTGSEIRD